MRRERGVDLPARARHTAFMIERLLRARGKPRAIPDLGLPPGLRLLVLAPHPDDFDAVGVTLRFLSDNGHALHVGVARTGSGVDDACGPGLTPAQKADLREREQRRSAEFFGLPADRLTFLALANGADDQVVETPGNLSAIEAFLSDKAPDIVFLPHGNDTNSAHRAVYALFRRSAARSGRAVAALLNRDPKTIEMRTDLYMPFGREEADWKAALLRLHDSQQRRNLRARGLGFDERILAVNRAVARELALDREYAEAFEVELL